MVIIVHLKDYLFRSFPMNYKPLFGKTEEKKEEPKYNPGLEILTKIDAVSTTILYNGHKSLYVNKKV